MFDGLSDSALLRIGIGVAALLLFVVIVIGARRKPGQGRRVAGVAGGERRKEPTLSEILQAGSQEQDLRQQVEQRPLDLPAAAASEAGLQTGVRPSQEFDKIVTLLIAARAGHVLSGPDLVVAAEKAGLVYGHMNIFHRLIDKHPEQGPIFSVASLVQPGSFDLRTIKDLKTPGISFFMTLPGPLPALDAWDTMLPTAQRMAELLDAVLLDADRNALGRQRIANIRDELRAWDRAREKLTIKPGR